MDQKMYRLLKSLSLMLLILLCGCSAAPKIFTDSDKTFAGLDPEEQEKAYDYRLFFQPQPYGPMDAFVGDTMPFYDDGKMNIFYLADQRDGKTGYHPWALMRTEDYCNYEDLGIVIPYAESAQQQDIALGTGCVIKGQDGLYHAFYTGHNDFYAPKEAIMHATSNDLLNWTKIPEDTFTSGGTYSDDDFRDPYVFYVESEGRYWMLVVTRYEKNGVIVKYTSDDLHTWKDEGVLFEDDMGYGTNMECPSLLKYKDKWYLAFSEKRELLGSTNHLLYICRKQV